MAKKPAKTEAEVPAAEAPAAVTKFKHSKNVPLLGDIKPEAAITWHVDKNPRAQGRGTYDRFQAYLGKATVKEYMEAGGTLGDLRWDIRSGYLSVAGVELGGELQTRKPAQPPKPKKAKAEPSPEAAAATSELAAATQEETID